MIGTRMHIKPRPGLIIRDPGNRGRLLPPEGRVVVVDEFWLRRVADKDVVASDPVRRSSAPVAAETPTPPPSDGPASESSTPAVAPEPTET